MFHTFAAIESYVLANTHRKRIALAGSHDLDTLSAAVSAKRKGIVQVTLIGKKTETQALLTQIGEPIGDYEIIDVEDDRNIADCACDLVVAGKADIPMKGILQTNRFLHAVLKKERGFVPDGGLISQATVFEFSGRLMILTDCAINMSPTYSEKLKIIQNAVHLAGKLGIFQPKVAALAPVELVNPAMVSTVEAAMLSKAAERGQLRGCVVDGPLALDNAVSKQAAQHKGIDSPVAGHADILLVPDLCSGNIATKCLTCFASFATAGTVNGTTVPVVISSRSDSAADKLHSILVAILQAS